MEFLRAFEAAGFSSWVRESVWALFAALIVHTISMAFLLGTAAAIDLRVLGFAQGTRVAMLMRFRPIMLWSAAVSIVSGFVLMAGYPAKALTNPLFYVKLSLLTGAFLCTSRLWRGVVGAEGEGASASARAKVFAAVSLVLLAAGLTTGKFLAHTAIMTFAQ